MQSVSWATSCPTGAVGAASACRPACARLICMHQPAQNELVHLTLLLPYVCRCSNADAPSCLQCDCEYARNTTTNTTCYEEGKGCQKMCTPSRFSATAPQQGLIGTVTDWHHFTVRWVFTEAFFALALCSPQCTHVHPVAHG